jgi:hypothetical protein
MTRTEIEKQIEWDNSGIGRIELRVPIFKDKTKFAFFSNLDTPNTLSDKMFETLEDVLHFPPDSKEKIKDLLWEECHFSFTVGTHGYEPKNGETIMEAPFRELNLKTKDDAYAKCVIQGVHITEENDSYKNRYALIQIDTVTDNLISIIVKNGFIIDYDDDGTYLGQFENDDKSAHHKRIKTLNGE